MSLYPVTAFSNVLNCVCSMFRTGDVSVGHLESITIKKELQDQTVGCRPPQWIILITAFPPSFSSGFSLLPQVHKLQRGEEWERDSHRVWEALVEVELDPNPLEQQDRKFRSLDQDRKAFEHSTSSVRPLRSLCFLFALFPVGCTLKECLGRVSPGFPELVKLLAALATVQAVDRSANNVSYSVSGRPPVFLPDCGVRPQPGLPP